jgi:hypothetical protein
VRRRRRGILSWLLMITLMIGAIVLLFFILITRAQHLARLDQPATPTPETRIERLNHAAAPEVIETSGSATARYTVALASDPGSPHDAVVTRSAR